MSQRHNDGGTDGRRLGRRQWLSMLGVGGAAALAGCSGGDGGGGSDGNGTNETDGDDGGDTNTDMSTYSTAVSASFTTLNPIYNDENGAGNAIARALDQGYTFDEENRYVPLLYDMSTEDGECGRSRSARGSSSASPTAR